MKYYHIFVQYLAFVAIVIILSVERSMTVMLPVPRTQSDALQTLSPDDLLSRYIAYVDAKPQTIRAYMSCLRRFFDYLRANGIEFHTVTRETVLRYRDEMLQKYKATTVALHVYALRGFSEWYESEGLGRDFAKGIKPPAVSKLYKRDCLSASEVRAVLQNIDRSTLIGKRDYAILKLMTTCGLRDIEVHNANIGDLSRRGNVPILYLLGKGRDERAEFSRLTHETLSAMNEYLKCRNVSENAKYEAIFVSHSSNFHDKRLSTRSISKIVKQRLRDVGIDSDRLTAHSLRHSAVTFAMTAGATLQEAQQFARHGSTDTTLIYAHNLALENNPCERLVENLINGL